MYLVRPPMRLVKWPRIEQLLRVCAWIRKNGKMIHRKFRTNRPDLTVFDIFGNDLNRHVKS